MAMFVAVYGEHEIFFEVSTRGRVADSAREAAKDAVSKAGVTIGATEKAEPVKVAIFKIVATGGIMGREPFEEPLQVELPRRDMTEEEYQRQMDGALSILPTEFREFLREIVVQHVAEEKDLQTKAAAELALELSVAIDEYSKRMAAEIVS